MLVYGLLLVALFAVGGLLAIAGALLVRQSWIDIGSTNAAVSAASLMGIWQSGPGHALADVHLVWVIFGILLVSFALRALFILALADASLGNRSAGTAENSEIAK